MTSRRRNTAPVLAAALFAGALLASAAAPASEGRTDPSLDEAKPAAAQAGQPYAPHWFPNELLEWTPGSDPDAEFNRSDTALSARVQDELTGANPDAAARNVMALSVFGDTSGNPSQGSDEFDYYLSEFWPYLDTLVFWGGSADEGLILAPNPTVTDAAHRNGVPVLGTVFLPPEAYGGDIESTRQLLQRDEEGDFPVAQKLIQAADYYGFDGWFVNAETEGADEAMAAEMRDFVAALSDGGVQVLWYDSMVESGAISWQNELNERNDDFFDASDLMFLNYDWDTERLQNSAALAESLGREPADLHAGIDVGSRQFDVQDSLDTLFPPGAATAQAQQDAGLSLGLYRPDFTLTGTDVPPDYAERESRFWVGADGDPGVSTPDADGFRGVSSSVAEHATVTRAPFATTFNTGRGTGWWQGGERWQSGEWNNLSAQDVLPTWRFMVRGPGAQGVAVEYDYEQAWRGGSSLRAHGVLDDDVQIPLFASRLTVDRDTEIAVTTRGRAEHQLLLSFTDAPGEYEEVPLGSQGDGEWNTRTVSLAAYEGRTLSRIGIQLQPPEETNELDYHLGGLRITDQDPEPPTAPENVRIEAGADTDARVFWSPSSSGVDRYQVEAVDADGNRTWLGTTTGAAFYARNIPAESARIDVVGLDPAGARGAPGSAPR